jgi:Ca2+-binding RTX toxin-like protein
MPTPKTYSFTFPAFLTGNATVDSLIAGSYWLGSNWGKGGTSLSYSFMAPGTSYFVTDYSPDNEYNALYELTPGQKAAVNYSLGTWAAVTNLNFSLTTDTLTNVGDLRFGGYRLMDNKTAAWAYFPANTPAGGDVWIGPQTGEATPLKGSYDVMTFIHEIGHALGLKHPFDVSSTNKTLLDPSLDDVHFTVMSYSSNYSYQPTTPMVLDILAIQSLYGVNTMWQTGDNVYKWAPDQSIFETIWDAGGNDTIDGSNQLAAVKINLNEGAYSQIGKAFTDLNTQAAINDGLAIAYGAKIENAIGSAFDDVLIGNALNNTLNGMAGADSMTGGDGNDTYYVDNAGDTVVELANFGSGIDTVISSISYTLGNNVENLTLVGTDNLTATGNALNNVLVGNSGSNFIDGGAGADFMAGGAGNDTYIVDNAGDVVSETSAVVGEIDNVLASVSFALGANIENLTLTGTGDTFALGNALNNVLIGNDGNNQLSGGAGLDTMIGGKGNDTYGLDQAGELALIQEQAGEGNDTLLITYASTLQTNVVDLNLSNLLNVENATLLGSGNFRLNGNALNNTLIGNADSNYIDGGAGADVMVGGAGNDIYIVDNVGDVVSETSTLASEIDTVQASISYTLGNNVENLTLTGTDNLNGTGNALNNTLIGNSGDNVLNGGAGADIMIGGAGNDTYIVDNAGDVVSETSTVVGEIDTVRASVSFVLGANLENLTLTGTADIFALGNSQDNVLIGNDGNNQLAGGAGLDTMIGGKGNDTYALDQAGELALVQELANEGIDTLQLTYSATPQTSTVDLNLSNLRNIENVTLLGSGNFTLTGNSLNNTLIGNADSNIIDGGAGADFMAGGAGNDTYIVDNIGDVVSETSTLANEIDTVLSSVNFALGANVENLTLTGTADIFALGNAQNNVLIGNDGNNQLSGGAGLDTMIGGKGNDTYGLDQSGELALIQELANEGTDTLLLTYAATSQIVDLSISNLQNVENVTLLGSGNFAVVGNSLNNVLIGNADNNILNGGAGADTLNGGAGNDTYVVDNVGDVVIEEGTSATEIDLVYSYINYTLGNNVENLTLVGTDNINATGNALNNVLNGNSGNNILDGGVGADFMAGGTGNDTYIVDNVGDVVSETSTLANEIDTVQASINYVLGANLENLTLTGTGDTFALGNALDNVLIGNDGNNQLSGGAGLDTMIGGKGNDTYGLDQAGELALIQEQAGEGNDTLLITYASTLQTNVVDLNLSNLRNVENATLLGSGSFRLNGNALNNTLIGNADSNYIDGGAGADFMAGGAGNDIYIVDNIGDVVSETSTLANEIDTVQASISYTLGNNVENLTLTGTDNLNGTGNALNNTLIGNSGDNVLDGGTGADIMIGGAGNDTYIVDNAGDVVSETSTVVGEIDTVRASVSYVLGANLENLTLTGAADIFALGNSLDNVLIGNDGNNQLSGGAGLDTMIGGKGNDTYGLDQAGELALIQELANEGTDTLLITYAATAQTNVVDLSLSNLHNVENVTLMGSGNFTLTGNSLNNTLIGNADSNIIDGGAGADFMAGGAGNDTYIVDNVGDVVSETSTLANEIDTVMSSINYVLGNNLENLTLTGTADIFALGNALNNVLIGNDGNNQLSGGAGLDTMIGGKGNDTYGLDQSGELALIQEQANEGNDTLLITYAATPQSSLVDLSISNLVNVENATLLGSGKFALTGNSLNNTLIGNADNNVLNGGAGADTLTGGAGADTFVFGGVNEMGTGSNRDVITDFNSAQGDKIDLTKFDANLLTAGFNGFTFIGAGDFTGAGQLRFVDHVLSGNVSGNAGADFEIQLVGVNSFSATDLVA